jgi:hypothetical protein
MFLPYVHCLFLLILVHAHISVSLLILSSFPCLMVKWICAPCVMYCSFDNIVRSDTVWHIVYYYTSLFCVLLLLPVYYHHHHRWYFISFFHFTMQGTVSLSLGQIMVAKIEYDHHCFHCYYVRIIHITITTIAHIYRTYYVYCRTVCLSRMLIRC